MASFDEFYRSLPEDSNKRGEFFEKVFIPWFLKTDPVWSSKVNQVWLWDDYPERWGKDCGIDLVYEDKQGKHWAIQSKCVSPDREISKAEIDSFLSESSDSRIYGRLLIASTDGIGKNAQQVIDRQEKQVVCFLLEQFRQSEVDFPTSPEDLSTGQRKEKRTPRPHQLEAINNVVEGLQKEDRGQLLMACGTGKTLTSLWINEALNAKRTLVLVPSLGLLSQTLREWSATSQEKFNWICVCSDKSVAKQDKTTDNIIERVSGLGVPVTSDPDEIKRFLQQNDGGIVFSTYQSSPLVEEVQRSSEVPAFDIAFADEAHRCAGKVSSAFGSILDDQKIKSKKRLFMTATPRVLSKRIKKKADDENIDLACMDDSSLFGEVFHQLNFSEAIERELLSDYQVVIVGVDDPSVEAKIIDRTIVDIGNEYNIDTETLANHIALGKAIKDYDLSRMITFHSQVKSAKKFSEDHPSIQDWMPEDSKSIKELVCSHASGEMSTKDRIHAINKLKNISKNEVGILTNARCLSEGVDVPTLDGIAFMDPKKSQIDIIQALGRAIRKSTRKRDGYIILPVYLGDTSNVEDSILQSKFQDAWKIIVALKSQDDSLSAILDQLRIEIGKRTIPTQPVNGLCKITFDLPINISTAFADSLTTILVRETTENWMEKYGKLIAYCEESRNASPPQSHQILGKWVSKQRQDYKSNKLNRERVSLLESIDQWTWDQKESVWRTKLSELHNYAAEHKALPSQHHETLGNWISTQRSAFKNNLISNERKELLEQVPYWSWNIKDEYWDTKYTELVNYTKNNSGDIPPNNHNELGSWITTQRKNYRDKSLSEDKIELLENISNWSWNVNEDAWTIKFNDFKNYMNTNNHLCPTQSHPTLGAWIANQRSDYATNEIQENRISLLENIDGWSWGPRDAQWKKMYLKLKHYLQTKSLSELKSLDSNVYAWANNQKSAFSNRSINKKRIQLLEALPSWEWSNSRWDRKYDLLKEYTEINKNARPQYSHPELGAWVSQQRSLKNSNKLEEERVEELQKLPGWVWSPLDAKWEDKFDELKEFAREFGHASPVKSHPTLGDWVRTQRRAYRNNKLNKTRIERLQKLKGWAWNIGK